MSLQCLVGSTVYLEFEFFNRIDGITPAPITDPTIKVYDSNQTQIGTTIVLTNANKLSEGKYFYYLTIPNNQPYIDVKMFCLNASDSDVASTRIEVIWSTDDIEDIPQIIITVGEDTYISLADANTYFLRKLDADAWIQASDTDKMKALIQATETIDNLNLRGCKYDLEQTLQFPRVYAVPSTQDLINLGIVPPPVKAAECLEALAILSNRNDSSISTNASLQAQGIVEIENGDSRLKFNGKGSGNTSNTLLSSQAKTLLRGYVQSIITIGGC